MRNPSRFFNTVRTPTFWLSIAIVVFAFAKFSDEKEPPIVRSDGRGYYAYLPAIFTFNDATFDSNIAAEKSYLGAESNAHYLFRNPEGKHLNKYFPGVALLQAPFYLAGSATNGIAGTTSDGYDQTHFLFFLFGALFYALLGVFQFRKLLIRLFPAHQRVLEYLVPVFYLATPLFYYSTSAVCFSHLYSFALFALFGNLVLNLRLGFTTRRFFYLGLVLGLIFLVRPTNGIVVLILPFLLGSKELFREFLESLFKERAKRLLFGIFGFFLVVGVLFSVWKWESGHWFLWSYGGEGFNLLRPQLWATLFSFRIGLFLQSPIVLLSFVGVILWAIHNRFRAFWWLAYFTINLWIVSSWWCWDYESAFGHRAFTEHFVFLLLPILALLKSNKAIALSFVGVFTVLGTFRLFAIENGTMATQRFTRSNYISSLAFWNADNQNRWQFTRSCPPFGRLIQSQTVFYRQEVLDLTPETEFACTGVLALHKPRTSERFYYRVVLDKHAQSPDWEEVFLVVDAKNTDGTGRYYRSVPLYNDRILEYNTWTTLTFEGQILDNLQEYDTVGIYIWNKGKKTFQLRNITMTVEEYKSD